mgnify:CR=1 FL=1
MPFSFEILIMKNYKKTTRELYLELEEKIDSLSSVQTVEPSLLKDILKDIADLFYRYELKVFDGLEHDADIEAREMGNHFGRM